MQTFALPPIPQNFTRTVAERTFICRDSGGDHPVRVEFGEPTQDVVVINGTDWRCPLRITVRTQSTVRSVIGIDSLQALQLAVNLARAELEAIATRPATVLLYLNGPIDMSQPGWQCRLL